MRNLVTISVLMGIALAAVPLRADPVVPHETKEQRDQRMQWFRDARFGMFIHWGLYAVPAGELKGKRTPGAGEWVMNESHIPVAEYEKFATQFNPVKFDARQWVRTAKNAGMRYIVITSKHHDGFDMFDSAVSDYTIVKRTPFKRDPMKELAEACGEEGITFCFYHSIMDWHHPDAQSIGYPNYNNAPHNPSFQRYVENYLKPQVKELLTNYGRIGIMWFDGEWIKDWTPQDGQDMYAWCRSIQPSVIVNNRVGKARAGMNGMNQGEGAVGDYGTPEQEIPATGFPGADWESCMTMNNTWGYRKDDNNWKPASAIIRMLIDCSSKGGNYLLNVGPTAEGIIPDASVERLAEVGKWMHVNSEAIYGTSASPFKKLAWGKCTQKTGKLYLHVFEWPKDGKLLVPLTSKVSKAYLLSDRDKPLQVASTAEGAQVSIPATAPDPVASVVVLEIEGTPQVIESSALKQSGDGSLALHAEDADISGSRAKLENRGGQPNIGYWSSTRDFVSWQAQINQPGTFAVEITYACEAPAGSKYAVVAGNQKLEGTVKATNSWDDFVTDKVGEMKIDKPGPLVLTVRPAGKLQGAGLMNLRSVTLKPVSQ
jgi:alpha-L-fucosidase